MSRPVKPREEVDAFKKDILDAALSLIADEGFPHVSMRKIAARLGVSATTIYNYYNSKDELYFFIRMRGFELLHAFLDRAYNAQADPVARMRAVVEEFLRFGIGYPDYYDIMFISRSAPKYLDCVGTQLETIALQEKLTALRPFDLIMRGIAEVLGEDANPRFLTIRLWCELNGIVSLQNSRLLREVAEDTDSLVRAMATDICNRFLKEEELL